MSKSFMSLMQKLKISLVILLDMEFKTKTDPIEIGNLQRLSSTKPMLVSSFPSPSPTCIFLSRKNQLTIQILGNFSNRNKIQEQVRNMQNIMSKIFITCKKSIIMKQHVITYHVAINHPLTHEILTFLTLHSKSLIHL